VKIQKPVVKKPVQVQPKRDETIKIETTVATDDMMKRLVGADPKVEEELIKQA
jgi:hypothetical protein